MDNQLSQKLVVIFPIKMSLSLAIRLKQNLSILTTTLSSTFMALVTQISSVCYFKMWKQFSKNQLFVDKVKQSIDLYFTCFKNYNRKYFLQDAKKFTLVFFIFQTFRGLSFFCNINSFWAQTYMSWNVRGIFLPNV